MKRTIKLFSVVLPLLFFCTSCDLIAELQSSTKLSFYAQISNKTGTKDTLLFTGKNLNYYVESTGELVFKDSLTPKKLISYHKIKCTLRTDSLFTFTATSDIMSSLVNDLVLNHNLIDGKYYFEDGYPDYIDNLGATTLRTQNKEKRSASWAKFIAQLKLEGKYEK